MPKLRSCLLFVRFGMFLLTSLLLISCGGSSISSISPHLVHLQLPISGAKVTIYELSSKKVLYETTTDSNGRWDIAGDIITEYKFVKILAKGGKSGKRILVEPLCAYIDSSRLSESNITIDILTTIECHEIDVNSTVKQIASKLKILSVLWQAPYIMENLYMADIESIVLSDVSWSSWQSADADMDTLNNWKEIMLGLNPSDIDSDHDTLSDIDELQIYATDANNSDTDGDFIPDQIEIMQHTDPIDPDEDRDGVADGLDGDPLFGYQWYIYSDKSKEICNTAGVKTIEGNDMGILSLYHQTLGNNNGMQSVQVVDGGVDANHPDLSMDLNRSINSINGSNDPTPIEGFSHSPVQVFYRGHGTAVAGIIGAIGDNGIGVRGVAPNIRIAGSNWLESESMTELEKVWYSGKGADDITISNNSWGTKFINERGYEIIMKMASEELRGGKGRIFVFAGGNEREEYSNSNLSYLVNNPYAIAVSAINHKNKYSSYSSPGSNILVSAYGGEHYYKAPTIMTTFTPSHSMYAHELTNSKGPITIDEDIDRDYTYAMNGTSAAAPIVSGSLALVLDLCPQLGWRDVKWLIAHSSTRIDVDDKDWIENSAGLWHSNNYGYGRINPIGMTQICLSPTYKNLPNQEIVESKKSYTDIIPDNNTTMQKSLSIEQDIVIEWVGLTIDIDHAYAGDLAIELVSPSGTVSHIIDPNFLSFNAYRGGFRFSTASLIGESSRGVWQIRIRDALEDDQGVLKGVKLEIRGHKL